MHDMNRLGEAELQEMVVDPFSTVAEKALGQVCCMIKAHEPYFGSVSVPASALIR